MKVIKFKDQFGNIHETAFARYVHMAYADRLDDDEFTLEPGENTKYLGIAMTDEATPPIHKNDYTWAQIRGQDAEVVTITNAEIDTIMSD